MGLHYIQESFNGYFKHPFLKLYRIYIIGTYLTTKTLKVISKL